MDDIKIGPVIPTRLQRRINRVIQIDDILTEKAEEQTSSMDQDNSLDSRVFVEPRLDPKPLHDTKTNWIDQYCKKTPKERVIWDSKVYAEWKKFENKSMYEQVEVLMDVSAMDFAECINKLTDDAQHKLSKEMIKKLFSIEVEGDIARSLHIQKIQRPVMSKLIADAFGCPELSIEDNIVRVVEEDKQMVKIKPKYHAFGRCLSPTSKQALRVKNTEPEPFKFPDDVRSGANLFKGIEHLKCTKALMKHLDEKDLPKPSYLVKMNALNAKSSRNTNEEPLYSLYQFNFKSLVK